MANTAANKITYDGKPVQVESAIRDGTGLTINATYVKKSTVSVPSTVPTLSWSGTATIGSVDGKDFKVKMPGNPNTDTKVTQVLKTDNYDRPPLMSDQIISTTTESVTGEARRNNSIYANTSTCAITAKAFTAHDSGFVNAVNVQTDRTSGNIGGMNFVMGSATKAQIYGYSNGSDGVVCITAFNSSNAGVTHYFGIGAFDTPTDIVMRGDRQIKNNVDNSLLRIQGGSAERKGGRLVASGMSRTNYPGWIQLVGDDGTNVYSFDVTSKGINNTGTQVKYICSNIHKSTAPSARILNAEVRRESTGDTLWQVENIQETTGLHTVQIATNFHKSNASGSSWKYPIKVVEYLDGNNNSAVRTYIDGFTIGKSVPSDAVFTDVSCTAVGNHYAPSADTSAALTANASGATAAWSIDVVKGVTLSRDAKGHVTGISVTSGKIPANPNTDTKVRQTLQETFTNVENHPLLLAYSLTSDTTASVDNIAYRNSSLYFKVPAKSSPGTGVLYAPSFSGSKITLSLGSVSTPAQVYDGHTYSCRLNVDHIAKTGMTLTGSIDTVTERILTVRGSTEEIETVGVGKVSAGHFYKGTTEINPVSYQSNLNSGKKIGTITIDGTPTDIYCTTNTDTLVKQTATSSTTTTYPLLFSAQSSPTSGTAYEARYSTNCYIKSNELYSNGSKVLTSAPVTSVNTKTGAVTLTASDVGALASNYAYPISLTAAGSSGTTLAHNTWYTLTAGGSSVIFKTPADNNTDTKVTQNPLATDNTYTYPLLASATASATTATTTTSAFCPNIQLKPLSTAITLSSSGITGQIDPYGMLHSYAIGSTSYNVEFVRNNTIPGYIISANSDGGAYSKISCATLYEPADADCGEGYLAAKYVKAIHRGRRSTFTMPAATTRCKLITISNADYVANNYTAHMKFRIRTAVSDPYENFTAEIHWSGAISNLLLFTGNASVTTSAPIRYISSYATKTLSSSGFGCFVMVENGGSTARNMIIEVLEADIPYTVETGTLAAHGQTDSKFNIDRLEVANNADRTIVSSGSMVTSITGNCSGSAGSANWSYYLYNDYWGITGEAITNGAIIAKGSDGKAYTLKSRTDKVFALPLTVGRANNAFNANVNCAVQHQVRNLDSSALTSMVVDVSSNIGAPLYIRGSLDSNGYFICDGHYSSVMTNGHTWVQIGSFARTVNKWNLDASHIQHAITLDSNGKVTHVDGRQIYNSGGTVQAMYPVGSVYINASDATNPATLFGFGTWELIGEGNVLLAGSTSGDYQVGTSYGSNTTDKVAAHSHTINGVGNHTHEGLYDQDWQQGRAAGNPDGWYDFTDGGDRRYWTSSSRVMNDNNHRFLRTSGGGEHTHSMESAGDATVSIMQQSIAVYMWKRTA